MQFSLDHKQRRHKQNQCSASVGLIFTRSYGSTLLITTPTTTPSLVKTSLSDGSRASFAGLNSYPEQLMKNGLLWREPEKKYVQPGTNWLSQCCDSIVFLPLTFLASASKKGFNMVDNSAGSMISSATGIFFSFLHAKVGRERLVYFIVSNHITLNLYFIKWIGLNLRRTKY